MKTRNLFLVLSILAATLGVLSLFVFACDGNDDDDDTDDDNNSDDDIHHDDDTDDDTGDDDDTKGACCQVFNCYETSEEECPGTWKGIGTDCLNDPCELTWTDTETDLIWVREPVPPYAAILDDAVSYCENLELTGYDDWYLPTISQLRSLIRGCAKTVTDGSCGVTDECTVCLDSTCRNADCEACTSNGGPDDGCYWPTELGGICYWYWSSTAASDASGQNFGINFQRGYIHCNGEENEYYVRCVRSATR